MTVAIASMKITGSFFFQFKGPSRTEANTKEEVFDRAGIYVPTLVREKIYYSICSSIVKQIWSC